MSEKLTEAQIAYMKAYASVLLRGTDHCPWNPFPRDSEWGRKIDEEYRRSRAVDEIRRRALSDRSQS